MTIVYHGVYLLFLLAGNDCNVNPYGTLLKPSMVEAVSTRSGVYKWYNRLEGTSWLTCTPIAIDLLKFPEL